MTYGDKVILIYHLRVAMAEWLARRTPNQTSWPIKNRPVWATGKDNRASVHSAVNEYLAWQLYLDYPWRLELITLF